MNARLLLETVRGEVIETKAIRLKIAELQESAFSVGGFDYGTERTTGNAPQSAPFENPTITAVDILRKYNDRLNRYAQRVDMAQELIDRMKDPTERSILIMRYLTGLEWGEITEALDKPERTVYDRHTKAINSLQAVIDEQERGKT